MSKLLSKINDELSKEFGEDNVVFTDEQSLIFIEDRPHQNKINKAVEIVSQFVDWYPYYDKAHNISMEQFQKKLSEIKLVD